jgi:hypothetical protein
MHVAVLERNGSRWRKKEVGCVWIINGKVRRKDIY